MAARWLIVKTFIREATENEDCSLVADPATVYARLRTLQRGAYSSALAENGLVQISSKIGETEFSFQIAEGVSPAQIMEAAETALSLIEGKTVAQMRTLLRRRRNTLPDFSTFRLL